MPESAWASFYTAARVTTCGLRLQRRRPPTYGDIAEPIAGTIYRDASQIENGRRTCIRSALPGLRFQRQSFTLAFAVKADSSMTWAKRYWSRLVAAVLSLCLLVCLGQSVRFHVRYRSVKPRMDCAEVTLLLGRPDAVGTAHVLGKKDPADVVWLYWRGLSVYTVEFDADMNKRPTTVYETWSDRRWSRGWFPPKRVNRS